jgi:hypothetical protein
MSDIDLAVNQCKRLESLLEEKLGAEGKGLHEKVSSVENRLPRELVRKLRLVATVRNKIVHEADYKNIDDRKKFLQAGKEAEKELRALGGKSKRSRKVIILIGVVIAIVIAAAVYRMMRIYR